MIRADLPSDPPAIAWKLDDDTGDRWEGESDPDLSQPYYLTAGAYEDTDRHRLWHWWVEITPAVADAGPVPFYAEGVSRDFDDAASAVRDAATSGWRVLERWVQP